MKKLNTIIFTLLLLRSGHIFSQTTTVECERLNSLIYTIRSQTLYLTGISAQDQDKFASWVNKLYNRYKPLENVSCITIQRGSFDNIYNTAQNMFEFNRNFIDRSNIINSKINDLYEFSDKCIKSIQRI